MISVSWFHLYLAFCLLLVFCVLWCVESFCHWMDKQMVHVKSLVNSIILFHRIMWMNRFSCDKMYVRTSERQTIDWIPNFVIHQQLLCTQFHSPCVPIFNYISSISLSVIFFLHLPAIDVSAAVHLTIFDTSSLICMLKCQKNYFLSNAHTNIKWFMLVAYPAGTKTSPWYAMPKTVDKKPRGRGRRKEKSNAFAVWTFEQHNRNCWVLCLCIKRNASTRRGKDSQCVCILIFFRPHFRIHRLFPMANSAYKILYVAQKCERETEWRKIVCKKTNNIPWYLLLGMAVLCMVTWSARFSILLLVLELLLLLPSSHMHLCQQYTIYYNMQTKARLVFGRWLLGHIDYVAVVGGGWRTTTLLTSFCQFILFVLAPRVRVRVRVCTACNFPHTLALNDSYW